jgi:hypothetical protein
MKTILLIVISIFTVEISFAQTGADYYLPLCTGNYLKFYTDGAPGSWSARNTFYSIIRSDDINSELYYLEKGTEILDINPTDTLVFHCFWLRKDSVGNILAGAYDPTNTGVIDSAIIINPPFLWFPDEYLTLGYSRSTSSAGITTTDSVISVSAAAGIYTNCIQIRSIRKNAGNLERIVDAYYAFHLGQVKGEILYPNNEAHTDYIVGYVATNCFSQNSSLLGKWTWIDGPASVLRYDYTNDSACIIYSANDTMTTSYILNTTDVPHRITWYLNGKKGSLGIWSISGDTLTIKSSGGDTTTFPSSFEVEANYNWVASHYVKQTAGINESRNIVFSLFPNPASEIVTLNINNTKIEDLEINIYSITGELVMSEMLKQFHKQINIGDLSNGIYMVEIKSEEWLGKQKLIIQR